MPCNDKNYVVRDSRDKLYEVCLSNGNLVLKSANMEQSISKGYALDYAADIDEDNKIHLVYYDKEGSLNHSIYYKKEFVEESILSINKGYTVTLINIKIIYSKLHIFYQAYNRSKGNITIYHNYLHDGKWVGEMIANVSSPNYTSSYSIDYHNEYIFFFYMKDYTLGKYSLKRFNGKLEKWEGFEDTITIKGAANLNIFILPSKVLIICFNKLMKRNIQAMIIYKDLNTISSLWSKEINISNSNKNAVKPIVFFSKGNIYVTWKQGNSIIYKKSTDLLTWSREFTLDNDLERKCDLLYISSNFKDSNLKINRTYMQNAEFALSIINSKSYYSCDSLNDNSTSNDIEIPLQSNYDESVKYKDDYIKKLLKEIEMKDRRIKQIKELNLRLKDEIDALNNLVHNYEYKLQNINNKQFFSNQNYSQTIIEYQNEIKSLEEEKNKLFMKTNERVGALLKVIEEKDIIIQKLYKIIKNKK